MSHWGILRITGGGLGNLIFDGKEWEEIKVAFERESLEEIRAKALEVLTEILDDDFPPWFERSADWSDMKTILLEAKDSILSKNAAFAYTYRGTGLGVSWFLPVLEETISSYTHYL